jgi:hypothetical protein
MFSAFSDTALLGFSDTHQDEKTLRFLKKQISEFIKHLKEKYPQNELTEKLLIKYSDVQLLPYMKGATKDTYTSGLFDHTSGIIRIAPRDGLGNIRSEESLNKSICHELAHGTRIKYPGESSHSQEWKDAWKTFLKIAADELEWKVEVPCSSVSFYGLTRQDCKNCKWDIDPEMCPKTNRLA